MYKEWPINQTTHVFDQTKEKKSNNICCSSLCLVYLYISSTFTWLATIIPSLSNFKFLLIYISYRKINKESFIISVGSNLIDSYFEKYFTISDETDAVYNVNLLNRDCKNPRRINIWDEIILCIQIITSLVQCDFGIMLVTSWVKRYQIYMDQMISMHLLGLVGHLDGEYCRG